MFLISGLHPNTGFYISEFKVDLAGNKRRIEFDMKWISQRLTYCLNDRYIAVSNTSALSVVDDNISIFDGH